jgi:hypothetical protein
MIVRKRYVILAADIGGTNTRLALGLQVARVIHRIPISFFVIFCYLKILFTNLIHMRKKSAELKANQHQ